MATLHHKVSISRTLEDHSKSTSIQTSRPTLIDKALSSKLREISFPIREVLTSTNLTSTATCRTKGIRGICRGTSLTITHEFPARSVVSLVIQPLIVITVWTMLFREGIHHHNWQLWQLIPMLHMRNKIGLQTVVLTHISYMILRIYKSNNLSSRLMMSLWGVALHLLQKTLVHLFSIHLTPFLSSLAFFIVLKPLLIYFLYIGFVQIMFAILS